MRLQRINLLLLTIFLSLSFSGHGQINNGSNKLTYLTIRGTKIYYEDYGKGAPLLLLHGGFGDISIFKKCIPELSKHFRLILPAMPGLGISEFPDSSLSYQLYAEYWSIMIDQLKLDSVFVIGLSDGAIAGLLLANKRPDKVKRLLASGANYKPNAIKTLESDKLTMLDTSWIKNNWKDWIANYTTLSSASADWNWKRYITEGRKMWLQEEYFPISTLENIRIPVMICFGDHDIISIEHGIEMKNAIKNSQFCIIPNSPHEVFAARPGLMNKIAIDFFSGK